MTSSTEQPDKEGGGANAHQITHEKQILRSKLTDNANATRPSPFPSTLFQLFFPSLRKWRL